MENKPTDIELVKKVKENSCEQSLSTLIQRHTPLCFDVCRKYAPALCSRGVDIRDVTDEKEYLVYKSALSFNPDKKTKFSTWLGNQVRYHCLNVMNKNNLIPTEDSQLNFFINKNANADHEDKLKDNIEYIDYLLSQVKDDRVEQVIKIRYFGNPNKKTPWKKVAQKIGVSTQTAINLHNKAMEMIRKKINTKNIYSVDRI